jgi:hypothetical protein
MPLGQLIDNLVSNSEGLVAFGSDSPKPKHCPSNSA